MGAFCFICNHHAKSLQRSWRPWFCDERHLGWLVNSCLCPHPWNDRRHAAEMMDDITGNVTEMLPGQIDGAMPELPTTTGPAMPIKSPF